MALLACPVAPDPDVDPDPEPEEELPTATEVESQTVSIGRSGGRILFDTGASLVIPPNAFVDTHEIVASRWRVPTDEGQIIEYRFEPAGLVFALPATLRLDVPAGSTSPEGLAVGIRASADQGFRSIGRLPDPTYVVAQLVETGTAKVIPDTGVRSVIGVAVQAHELEDGTIVHAPGTHLEGTLRLVTTDDEGAVLERTADVSERGLFRFNDVPAGDYKVHFTRHYATMGMSRPWVIESDRSTLDLGLATTVRPNATFATADSSLSIQLEAASSLDGRDLLQMSSRATDLWAMGFWSSPNGEGPLFQAHFTAPSRGLLVDADEGDVVVITRKTRKSSADGVEYLSAVEQARIDSIIQTDGGVTEAVGSLVALPHDRSISTTMHVRDFMDVTSNPGATGCNFDVSSSLYRTFEPVSVETEVLPGVNTFGPELLRFDWDEAGAPVQSTGVLRYASDGPTTGFEVFSVLASTTAMHLLPGTRLGPIRICHGIQDLLSVDDAQAGPIGPRLSPPDNLRVNGTDVRPNASAVPLSEDGLVITWDAPELGKAGDYRVTLRKYDAQGERTRLVDLRMFRTYRTQLEVPADLFEAGDVISIYVEAWGGERDMPLRDFAQGPWGITESGLIRLTD